ncbi:MAG: hypothetical protein ABIQ16_26720 [Polyangiaceae bacterium]
MLISLGLIPLALVAFGYGVALVSMRVYYEALGPYNVDTSLYWTVGRGMLNGLVPYRDLYETKPPGIFLLSALSYLLTSGFGLTHITQILSLVFVALSPLAFVRPHLRSSGQMLRSAPVFIALWAVVLLIVAYVADRGDSVQVEPHGLVGVVLYLVLLGKPGRWAFFGRTLGVAAGIGMKEPFFLLILAVYLVSTPNARRKWQDLFGPLLLAAAAGTLVLLAFGWFSAYTSIYLKSMLGAHVQLTGSPIARATIAFNLTWDDLHAYSTPLPAMLVYCMGLYLFLPEGAAGATAVESVSKRFQALTLSLLLAGLAVGMGGLFYAHHYIFAVPVFLATIFALLKRLPDSVSLRAGFVALTLATVFIPWAPSKVFRERAASIATQDAAARKGAVAVDDVLDRLHVSRYLFLGTPGYAVLPYTRHSPLGPLFFQQGVFFEGHYPWFVDQFRQRLHEAQVIVLHARSTGPFEPEVSEILAAEFRPLPARFVPAGKHLDPILVRKDLILP